MTPLKPIENRRVRGVSAEKYPLNPTCAHPECFEPTADGHHAFPRSSIGNASWFVEITDDDGNAIVIPHTTGLCRAHHNEVELHAAWIKLEDGIFSWYDREKQSADEVVNCVDPQECEEPCGHPRCVPDAPSWKPLGPLDPQPGGREKVARKKRKKFQGEARRKRTVVSIKVPKDAAEDGAGVLFDLISDLEAKLGHEAARPPYYTLVDALSYTVLNSDATDFA